MLMRQRGVSLVEILVSMTLGLFLLLGLTTFMANTLVSDSRTMLMSRLDQEMRSAMILMVREVRRAGYWGNPSLALGPWTGAGAGTAYANPFAAVTASGGAFSFATTRITMQSPMRPSFSGSCARAPG